MKNDNNNHTLNNFEMGSERSDAAAKTGSGADVSFHILEAEAQRLHGLFDATSLCAPQTLLNDVFNSFETLQNERYDCEKTIELLDSYLDGSLSENEEYLVHEHFFSCETCFSELQTILNIKTAFKKCETDAPNKVSEVVYSLITAEIDEKSKTSELLTDVPYDTYNTEERLYAAITKELDNTSRLQSIFEKTALSVPSAVTEKITAIYDEGAKSYKTIFRCFKYIAAAAAVFALVALNYTNSDITNIRPSENTKVISDAAKNSYNDNKTDDNYIINDVSPINAVSSEIVTETEQKNELTKAQPSAYTPNIQVAAKTKKTAKASGRQTDKVRINQQVSTNKQAVKTNSAPKNTEEPTLSVVISETSVEKAETIIRNERATVIASDTKEKFNNKAAVSSVGMAEKNYEASSLKANENAQRDSIDKMEILSRG